MNNQLSLKLNQKLSSLLDSYKTLKMILMPNLSDDQKFFMKSIIDIILFQIRFFIRIAATKEQKIIFDLLNYNNQVLSQKITSFYDHFNTNKSNKKETNPIKISENKKFLEFNLNDKITVNENLNKINAKSSVIKINKSMKFIKIKEKSKKHVNKNNSNNILKYNEDYNTDDKQLITQNNNKDDFLSNDKFNNNVNIRNYINAKVNLQKNENRNLIDDNDFIGLTSIRNKESEIFENDKEKTFTKKTNNISNYSNKNYNTMCPTARLVKKLNKIRINTKTLRNNKSYNNLKTKNHISDRVLCKTISKNNKSNNNNSSNNNNDSFRRFSLDEFLIPYNLKNAKKDNKEKLYLTKEGKILLNDHQKNIIEKYVNKCASKGKTNLVSKKFSKDKTQSVKNFHINENISYDEKEAVELLNLLPSSLQKTIDYFINKKCNSFLYSVIMKACHKTIDNYNELERKEKNFGKKKSRNKDNIDSLVMSVKSISSFKPYQKRTFDTEANNYTNINKTVENF